jgi:hypothetical protein
VLANGFSENRQFATKTDQNSIFLGRDPHIADWLYIVVPHISFDEFLKNKIFAQNSYVLAYGFTKNPQFTAKTDRNSVFLSHDPHIADWLYIVILYMSFYRFKKIKFSLKIYRC